VSGVCVCVCVCVCGYVCVQDQYDGVTAEPSKKRTRGVAVGEWAGLCVCVCVCVCGATTLRKEGNAIETL
jgi:hypothetical protein